MKIPVLSTCAGALGDSHDPADHFTRLNLLSTQIAVLLRHTNDRFVEAVKAREFCRILAFNLKALLLSPMNDATLEDWMVEHEKETRHFLVLNMIKVICRMIEVTPDEAESFFRTHYSHKEHFVRLVEFLEFPLNLDLLLLLLNCADRQLHIRAYFSKVLEQGLSLSTNQLKTLLLLSGKEASLPSCLAIVRRADEDSSMSIVEALVAVCAESHLATLQFAIEGTKNLRAVRIPRRIPELPLQLQPVDEFKALLDDKSYIEQVQQNVLDQLYEDEEGEDDDPVDLHGESKSSTGLSDELLRAYIQDPEVFKRGVKMRQTDARKKLCERLKMTHEQIEGWAVMLARNPKKESLLRDYQLLNYKNL